jgi:hypothetical protein
MDPVDKRPASSWRYRLPLLQGFLAVLLLLVAGYEHKAYYDWFFKAYPQAFEIDYSYNPPARLIALVICGPGLVVPSGTNAYDPSWRFAQVSAVFCVMAFWFLLGWLIDRRMRGLGPVIRNSLLRSTAYGAFAVLLFGFCEKFAYPISSAVRNGELRFILSFHGLRARPLMDFAAILWMGGLSVFCVGQFFVSVKGALASFRR